MPQLDEEDRFCLVLEDDVDVQFENAKAIRSNQM